MGKAGRTAGQTSVQRGLAGSWAPNILGHWEMHPRRTIKERGLRGWSESRRSRFRYMDTQSCFRGTFADHKELRAGWRGEPARRAS